MPARVVRAGISSMKTKPDCISVTTLF